ncbi:MAG TPA: CPXCG motif-containing cysteine-rich protein [Candidatus Kapabacteria bacterium]|nr:CPXCG motif-containing cysteine-rich protein [Candidatus Kapabacteria bacterium]
MFLKPMVGTYICAVCGEEIETVVDESQGLEQEYIEDCAICCRPNMLRVSIDPLNGEITMDAAFEE